jgi:hypothetical protein
MLKSFLKQRQHSILHPERIVGKSETRGSGSIGAKSPLHSLTQLPANNALGAKTGTELDGCLEQMSCQHHHGHKQ